MSRKILILVKMENKSNNEIKVKEMPSMVVASCFSTGRSPEAEVIRYMESWIKRSGLDYSKLRKFGFDIPVSEEQRKYGLRSFEFWVTVPENTVESESVKVRLINSSHYAVLRIKNPYKDPQVVIRAGWRMLEDWAQDYIMKKKNEKIAAGFEDEECAEEEEEKERYMLEEIIETSEGVCLDLYFPLE